MSDFRIFETDEFLKKLDKLPPEQARFLRRKLMDYVYPQLKIEPFLGPNIKKLKGFEPPTWRYRIGKFRLFYLIDPDEKILFMLSVDPRKGAYR